MAIAKMLLDSAKSMVLTKLMRGDFGELPRKNSRKHDKDGGIYDRVDAFTKQEFFGECLGRGHIFKLITEVWTLRGDPIT